MWDGATCETPVSFAVDALGRWTVEYSANDGNELFAAQQRFTFDIEDVTAPKIYVNGDVPATAEKGKEIQFPAAYVFDNVTPDCPYHIIVIEPDGMRRVAKDGKFTFANTGRHVVQYYAYDGYMNVARVSYEITVS